MTRPARGIAAVLLMVALTACTKTATITVDPGMNGPQPDVKCEVIVPSADVTDDGDTDPL